MRTRMTYVTAAIVICPVLLAAAPPEETAGVMRGEKLDPADYGPGILETMEEALARVAMEPAAAADPKGRNGQQGAWAIPSRGATYYPHSGEHNIVNKWGDTRMGIAFPVEVDIHGAYFAGQGGEGVWTRGIRAVGYRHGVEVAHTEWFREIGDEPVWFEMDLRGVDRLVIEAEPRRGGGGWYALDDLTYTVKAGAGQSQSATIVLDFEDTSHTQLLTGLGYHGLTWEMGTGDFEVEQDVIPSPRRVVGEDTGSAGTPVPAAGLRGLGTIPQLGASYQGVIRGDAGSFAAPPDTCGAVGPNHFVETVNRMFAVYDKNTGANVLMTGLGTLFPGGNGDPRILWDQHSGRWIGVDSNFIDRIYVSVSATDDPTGVWFKTSFLASTGPDTGCFPDYPTLGVDADGIYMSSFMVGCGLTIFAVDKAPLIAASPSLGTVTAFRNLNGGTIQAVHTYGNPGREWFITTWGTSKLQVKFLQGPLTAPTLTDLLSASAFSVTPFSFPPDVPALGSATNLDSVDDRLMNAVYRDGVIWTAHSVAGGAGTAVRWYEIDPLAQSVVQSGTVSDASLNYWMPSIMVNIRGDAVMGFSGSNAGMFASCYYTGRLVDDPPGEMADPVLLRLGQASHNIIDGFGRNRWGDYSLCSLDPDDELTMWTIQEYVDGIDLWGTQFAQLLHFIDCNNNNTHDFLDITGGLSIDVNVDGIPDECQVTRLFVDASAGGGNFGVSWTDAFSSVARALDTAAGSGLTQEIWVAAGQYTPDASDRGRSFNLVSGVGVYGGFAGGEINLGDRDPLINVTVLSGDLAGDDGGAGTAENSYRVVGAVGADATAILDGFTIRAGNGNAGFPDNAGAGVFIDGGGPTITDCIIESNQADTGGALYISQATPNLVNCTIMGNNASAAGGGAYIVFANPTFTSCSVLGNTTASVGGGLFVGGSGASATLVNSVLSGNSAGTNGGAMYDVASGASSLINSSLSGNSAGTSGGGLYSSSNNPTTVGNSVLFGNTDVGGSDESAQIHVAGGLNPNLDFSCVEGLTGGLGGTGNIASNPSFADPDGADNILGTADDNLRLQGASPCIDAADNAAVPGGVTTDRDGNARFVDDPPTPDTGSGTPPIVDMGAYEAAAGGEAILTAASLLVHGATERALDLMANNIEPRINGVTKLVFGLTGPVSSVGASVSCVNNVYAGSVTATPAGATLTVTFVPALPDQDCCEITLTGDATDSFSVRTLEGDLNQDGSTNPVDNNQALLLFGLDAVSAGVAFDFNRDDAVNPVDTNQVLLRFGSTAPTCP